MGKPQPKLADENDRLESMLENSYALLRRIAQKQLEQNRGITISATDLVHEFYIKMNENGELQVNDSQHFVSIASQCMRWLMMDYAKSKRREKRGGGGIRITFDENLHGQASDADPSDLVQTLEELATVSPRAAQVAEMRYLLGLDIDETAKLLGISKATVKREWSFAKDWLSKKLLAAGKK